MEKTITSPVSRFPGEVTLPDFLTFPQATAWERALADAQKLREDDSATAAEFWAAWIPGIMAVVQEWRLQGFDPQNWPATPRKAVSELINWLIGEVSALYDDEAVPNA